VVSTKRKPPFSDDTKYIKKVDIECEKLNDNVIDSKHVILAILSSKLPINDILSVAGINYNSFNKKTKRNDRRNTK
jgi:hypothetical protein